jgi:hypothetical protein
MAAALPPQLGSHHITSAIKQWIIIMPCSIAATHPGYALW